MDINPFLSSGIPIHPSSPSNKTPSTPPLPKSIHIISISLIKQQKKLTQPPNTPTTTPNPTPILIMAYTYACFTRSPLSSVTNVETVLRHPQNPSATPFITPQPTPTYRARPTPIPANTAVAKILQQNVPTGNWGARGFRTREIQKRAHTPTGANTHAKRAPSRQCGRKTDMTTAPTQALRDSGSMNQPQPQPTTALAVCGRRSFSRGSKLAMCAPACSPPSESANVAMTYANSAMTLLPADAQSCVGETLARSRKASYSKEEKDVRDPQKPVVRPTYSVLVFSKSGRAWSDTRIPITTHPAKFAHTTPPMGEAGYAVSALRPNRASVPKILKMTRCAWMCVKFGGGEVGGLGSAFSRLGGKSPPECRGERVEPMCWRGGGGEFSRFDGWELQGEGSHLRVVSALSGLLGGSSEPEVVFKRVFDGSFWRCWSFSMSVGSIRAIGESNVALC